MSETRSHPPSTKQTKLSLLGTWNSTRAPSAFSPRRKIGCLSDRIVWTSWPLLLWRQRRCSHYCDIGALCGSATPLLWTRVMSSWDRSLISMVSARWSSSPHNQDINECSAGNVSTTRHFPWRQCSMAGMFTWSLRLWLLFMGYLKSRVFTSNPRTIVELKQSIKEQIVAILEQMTRRVMENLGVRLKQYLRNGGRHLSDVLFKTYKVMYWVFQWYNFYIKRWNLIILFHFKNHHVFLPHPVYSSERLLV